MAGAAPSPLPPQAIGDAFALAAGGEIGEGEHPLVGLVTETRLEALALLTEELVSSDDPGKPFIAELIALG